MLEPNATYWRRRRRSKTSTRQGRGTQCCNKGLHQKVSCSPGPPPACGAAGRPHGHMTGYRRAGFAAQTQREKAARGAEMCCQLLLLTGHWVGARLQTAYTDDSLSPKLRTGGEAVREVRRTAKRGQSPRRNCATTRRRNEVAAARAARWGAGTNQRPWPSHGAPPPKRPPAGKRPPEGPPDRGNDTRPPADEGKQPNYYTCE